jgi:hypothetical protein
MTKSLSKVIGLLASFALIGALFTSIGATSLSFELASFERTWERTDLPVKEGQAVRTWMWGPEPHTEAYFEPYIDAPDEERLVQYSDKSRMEDNSWRADPPWDVTNGLLAYELITGKVQIGDELFEEHEPAAVHVAGDPNPDTPTYATFTSLLDYSPIPTGWTLIQTLESDGTVAANDDLASYAVTAEHHVPETDHTVASVFWEFMNSTGVVYENGEFQETALFENPFFATGYPITESYWVYVPVDHEWQDVLVQCFERRCLTFTPGNPEGWQVEAGNIGQHHYQWRSQQEAIIPDDPADDSDIPVPVDPTPTPAPPSPPGPPVIPLPPGEPVTPPAPSPTPEPIVTPTPTLPTEPDPTPTPAPEPIVTPTPTPEATPPPSYSDTTPPELVEFDFSPDTIDASTGGTITFTARITDDLAGFNYGAIRFSSPSGNQSAFAFFDGSDRISGSPTDGVYEFTMSVSQYSESGTWEITNLELYDSVGNSIWLYDDALDDFPFRSTFEVH